MTFEFYKTLHLIGILATFMALGALTLHSFNGGGKEHPGRKLVGITHALALIIVLVAGFGMIAKARLGMPGWIWAKLIIWLLFGAALAFIPKRPELAKFFWVGIIAVGAIAAYLAMYKPF